MRDPAERAIAIVGVGGILPDADSAHSFWQNICAGRYSIADVPSGRWDPADYYDPDPTVPDKTYSKIGGWVRGFAFDWKRFRVPPRVAASMDEGQQWAVTAAAQALADYGYPDRPLDTERTGVILGAAMGGDLHLQNHSRISFPEFANALESAPAFQALSPEQRATIRAEWHQSVGGRFPQITEDSMPGELSNVIAGRVANALNLRGPNFVTDAACASSLAAVSTSVDMLADGHCDAVLTGGVDRNMSPSTFVKFSKVGALSATGSRPFSDGADGFVMAEGCALFLLKRLADAERDGDHIYAVIRGLGVSSDGRGRGITAPNPVGQRLAIDRAWTDAGLPPESVTLIEAHGTSTRVGDAVELETLAQAFAAARPGSIALGSVKGNIGHLKAAAGGAGLMKVVLALDAKLLPATLNAMPSNPGVDLATAPFRLNQETREWPQPDGHPRRAGLSSYGFGGTNFHLVLEEHVPGALTSKRLLPAGGVQAHAPRQGSGLEAAPPAITPPASLARHEASAASGRKTPPRAILALGAATPERLTAAIEATLRRLTDGWQPPVAPPDPAALAAPERLVLDCGDAAELRVRLDRARTLMATGTPRAWKALRAQGIFRASGGPAGKIAYLFPGQGSQYLNMGRALAASEPVVAEVFAEADAVMEPILGAPLTSYIFVDEADDEAKRRAELGLRDTAVTQPAMLTMDIAMARLLATYGFRPDMVMGHSLGEYAALIAAGVMPFAHALEATAARGREMCRVSVADNGWMAAVFAPHDVVVETLREIDGYVVAANVNSNSQCVIGGASKAVERAIQLFEGRGVRAVRIPVSHAFHTAIVAPASGPLRRVLDRLDVRPPHLPLVSNVTGGFYPSEPDAIKDLLERQIASPVQWVAGSRTLFEAGARTLVEVGPKKALKGFADDLFGGDDTVLSLFCNHPKLGELQSFNYALCGLYAAGHAAPDQRIEINMQRTTTDRHIDETQRAGTHPSAPDATAAEQLGRLLAQVLGGSNGLGEAAAYDRDRPPAGSVVITGTGLGLPGTGKAFMDPDNAMRILRGEQFIDLFPQRFRDAIIGKRITRLVKDKDGTGHFETLSDPGESVKLAGRPGSFDLAREYGVPPQLVEALDVTSQLAMAAGLDALREAGIPLVRTYRRTTTGSMLPDRWLLPESMRDETGVIFASVFPGLSRFSDELQRYHTWQNRKQQLTMLEDLMAVTSDPVTAAEIGRRAFELREVLASEPYEFDRRFIFRILAMGHSQFAEYIGARGPNTQINAACSSATQAMGIAEDWIRSGRCRRVLLITADAVTDDHMLEWVGAGFQALGAAATDDRVADAALPFDRRRHGLILGMGAAALVVESEDAVRERGMRGMVEVLASEIHNSAFHVSRLDPEHIAGVMDKLVTSAERRFGINRHAIAAQTVFVSHETYTPARGGSASAEIAALQATFGTAADAVLIANTKGFTGHPMAAAIEDVTAVNMLTHAIVPPVPNFAEPDPDLGRLNLSRGGRYPVHYALRLAAGLGSQIAMILTRRIPGGLNRVDDKLRYDRWLAEACGRDLAATEVVSRVLRVRDDGPPVRSPAPSCWVRGHGPSVRAAAAGTPPAAAQTLWQAQRHLPVATTAPVAVAAPVTAPPAPATRTSAPASAAGTAPRTSSVAPAAVAAPASAVAPAIPAVPATASATATAASAGGIEARVVRIVAEKTGYPEDMLALDLDLEADLGVDTVKQAETFAEIRAAFGIPRLEQLRLRDYPTLGSVVQFVRDHAPGAQAGATSPCAPAVQAPTTRPATQDGHAIASPAGAGDPITARVIGIVAEKTGYPEDMLALDLDLEADLGVDTVKQAETFAEIRAAFNIPRLEQLRLRDYPTLGSVVQFVRDHVPAPERPAAAVEQVGRGEAEPAPASAADPVAAKVIAIVAGKTGYPEEMLEMDLDLEADLGIDTVKQAETFAEIRTAFAIPRPEELRLRDYPTLGAVVQFVRNSLAGGTTSDSATELPRQEAPAASPAQPRPQPLAAAQAVVRRVPVPVLRPSLELCKSTGLTLHDGRVIVMADTAGAGRELIAKLQQRGVTALELEAGSPQQLAEQVRRWRQQGPIQGMFWLAALDVEPPLFDLDLPRWRELNALRLKGLFAALHALEGDMGGPGTFLVCGTRMGGLHGYGPRPATSPLGGAVTGFAKAYKREHMEALVKAVDFAPAEIPASVAEALLAEALSDPGAVEIGRHDGLRYAIGLEEPAATPAERQGGDDQEPTADVQLRPDSVVMVTGAAGGITSAIIADLAAAGAGTFYLLDLAPEPPRDDAEVALLRSDREALKRTLIEQARAAGEKVTPQAIERRLQAAERRLAALDAIEAVERTGGVAHYRSLDLTDAAAVAAVLAQVREKHGRIDVLLHAAGLEISRALADKSPEEFDRVFDVKADGLFNLLAATGDMPLGTVVVFSSVAARFGNSGQCDYAAANDLLCKVMSNLRLVRPQTRGLAIDWTAWSGIGMASRGSIPTVMQMAGIEMLAPDAGIAALRRELALGTAGEVVLGGELGALVRELAGGVDLAAVNAGLAAALRPATMLGEVTAIGLYTGLEVETTLDPTAHPFLDHHRVEGDLAYLPGVMGIEGFAELASTLAPQHHVAAVRRVQLVSPFKFYRNQPRVLRWQATITPLSGGELVMRARLRSLTEPPRPELPPREQLHFTAEVLLTVEPVSAPVVECAKPGARAAEVGRNDIYKTYFHGPAYQVLERVHVEGDVAYGLMACDLPPDTQPAGAELLMAPRLVELCFQTAGLWEISKRRVLALPREVGSVVVHRRLAGEAQGRVWAVVHAREDGTEFDARVVDEHGNLLVTVEGYRTVALSSDPIPWWPEQEGDGRPVAQVSP